MAPVYHFGVTRLILGAILLVLLIMATGCGTLHGSAQVGPDLKPHVNTSITFPLGKN